MKREERQKKQSMDNEILIKYLPVWRRYLDMLRGSGLSFWRIGQLFVMMMEYHFEGKEPRRVPKALRALWIVVRKDLDDARRCYEKNVTNGSKGGRKKKQSARENTVKNPEDTQKNPHRSLSTTMSTTSSTTATTSMSSSIDTGSAPAVAAGVCCETQSFGEFGWVKLTDKQYDKLLERLGYEELHRCITYVDEAAQSTNNRNRWKDWYLILRRCHENRWHETKHPHRKEEIPKGASGILGEAELEAIARVMAQ